MRVDGSINNMLTSHYCIPTSNSAFESFGGSLSFDRVVIGSYSDAFTELTFSMVSLGKNLIHKRAPQDTLIANQKNPILSKSQQKQNIDFRNILVKVSGGQIGQAIESVVFVWFIAVADDCVVSVSCQYM